VAGTLVDKVATPVAEDAEIIVHGGSPYVSRGGFKLAGALDAFGFDPQGLVAADVGASTGALPIACCSAAPGGCMPSTWAMGNWPGRCGRTSGWW
jgi:hypothetical protein